VHEVEHADAIWLELVDAAVDELHARSEPARRAMSIPVRNEACDGCRRIISCKCRREIHLGERRKINTRHLGAAALELECSEPVKAPNVEARRPRRSFGSPQ
jgi:hypothetical protein